MAVLRKTVALGLSHIVKVASFMTSPSASAPTSRLPDLLAAGFRSLPHSFLQTRPLFQMALPPPEIHARSLPSGVFLGERIPGLYPGRLRLDLPLTQPTTEEAEVEKEEEVPMKDVRKMARASQMDAAMAKLKATGKSCISRLEFLRICCEVLGKQRGEEVARSLDASGTVIVWDNVVFLRPEELAKSIEKSIPTALVGGDAAERELMRMEKTKAEIDRRAEARVRRELWLGLGLLTAQTAAFMRLTFWELSWDVMEPICFYFTSVYFMVGYTFFLRTSKEPSFEGFFETRFAARQKRLMEAEKFDLRRFEDLRRACGTQPRSHCSSRHCHLDGKARGTEL